ncbi:hypothetical protein [Kineococcus aurantiacus]|uniref:Chromate transport protein ChrA n=1 Tax=Kineococcus aurantiacus TaxID=37633 RepID=A0A7Y9DKA1_9ACTN|nr:hypothetical protein [Kineococcus aurantiacus]NYD22138.1 chromate transport protein ChrA [Kineococcus aurantiacus]
MSAHTTPSRHEEQRAIAPIRWPRPSGGTVVALVIWLVGVLVSAVVPLLLLGADPYEAAPGGRIVVGLVFTLVGALIMVFSAYLLYRKSGSIGAAILAFVPSFVMAVLGILMTTMKVLYGV